MFNEGMLLGFLFVAYSVVTFLGVAFFSFTKMLRFLKKEKYLCTVADKYVTRFKLFFIISTFGIVFFICFLTGPENLEVYPKTSLYKLPWKYGVSRFVGQGNRSFSTHRAFYEYSWDFVMPNGTKVLAARDGRVIEIEDHFDGFGMKSNFVKIEHEDGTQAVYAHIKKNGSLIKLNEHIVQGEEIALSGMVGWTIYPHLHFHVLDKNNQKTIPVTFKEILNGVPLAGRFYTSENNKNMPVPDVYDQNR